MSFVKLQSKKLEQAKNSPDSPQIFTKTPPQFGHFSFIDITNYL